MCATISDTFVLHKSTTTKNKLNDGEKEDSIIASVLSKLSSSNINGDDREEDKSIVTMVTSSRRHIRQEDDNAEASASSTVERSAGMDMDFIDDDTCMELEPMMATGSSIGPGVPVNSTEANQLSGSTEYRRYESFQCSASYLDTSGRNRKLNEAGLCPWINIQNVDENR